MSSEIKVRSPKFMAAILMLGAFIGLFGETALNMALTNIMEQFSIEASTAQWLTTGYLLTLAILVPISASLMTGKFFVMMPRNGTNGRFKIIIR